MPSITMTAPSDLQEGSIIKAYDGTKMVNVCVPSDVEKGDQFAALVVGPSEDDEEAPKTVKASPVLMNGSSTEHTASSSPHNISVNVSSPTNAAPSAKKNSCMATAGMVCGILGFFFFGIILGPLAIIFSSVAKCKISDQPNEYEGHCQANAGLVLGIIDIVIWAVILVLWLGA